jgi:hypothetical protein
MPCWALRRFRNEDSIVTGQTQPALCWIASWRSKGQGRRLCLCATRPCTRSLSRATPLEARARGRKPAAPTGLWGPGESAAVFGLPRAAWSGIQTCVVLRLIFFAFAKAKLWPYSQSYFGGNPVEVQGM